MKVTEARNTDRSLANAIMSAISKFVSDDADKAGQYQGGVDARKILYLNALVLAGLSRDKVNFTQGVYDILEDENDHFANAYYVSPNDEYFMKTPRDTILTTNKVRENSTSMYKRVYEGDDWKEKQLLARKERKARLLAAKNVWPQESIKIGKQFFPELSDEIAGKLADTMQSSYIQAIENLEDYSDYNGDDDSPDSIIEKALDDWYEDEYSATTKLWDDFYDTLSEDTNDYLSQFFGEDTWTKFKDAVIGNDATAYYENNAKSNVTSIINDQIEENNYYNKVGPNVYYGVNESDFH
jgi:hypothetical protein